MPISTGSKQALAERAWRLLFDFFLESAPRRSQVLARRKLSPNDARALHMLQEQPGHPLNVLAREWGCDPSYATAIVDRLERAGLAERRPLDTDRRVKLVVLTPRGTGVKRELMAEFQTPPAELLALTRPELETLARLMAKLKKDA